jgi:phosphoglycerate dehydrogenase-like enzyme
MVRGRHLELMRSGATLINTSRGGVVAEAEMIGVLRRRPELFAVLDVTEKEPADPNSPLFDLPNVVLTPHIAGSTGQECRRMGRCMVEELKRYLAGEPLKWRVTEESAAYSTHRSSLAPPMDPVSDRLRRNSRTLTVS